MYILRIKSQKDMGSEMSCEIDRTVLCIPQDINSIFPDASNILHIRFFTGIMYTCGYQEKPGKYIENRICMRSSGFTL